MPLCLPSNYPSLSRDLICCYRSGEAQLALLLLQIADSMSSCEHYAEHATRYVKSQLSTLYKNAISCVKDKVPYQKSVDKCGMFHIQMLFTLSKIPMLISFQTTCTLSESSHTMETEGHSLRQHLASRSSSLFAATMFSYGSPSSLLVFYSTQMPSLLESA